MIVYNTKIEEKDLRRKRRLTRVALESRTVVDHSDRKLVERLLAGDERAFQAFFNTYFPRLYRFALPRVGGDADRAEDAVQVALCKAISKLDTYRGEAALFTWLCTITRREISDQIRHDKHMSGRVEVTEDDPEIRAVLESLSAFGEEQPDQIYAREEIARFIQVTLDYLPTLYGDVLEWKYIQGMSVKEIAERIGRRPKAVESLLTRARAAFREGIATLADELRGSGNLLSELR